MLTGSPPYVGSSSHAVLAQIVEGDAPAVSSVRKSVPPNVDAAIRKGLEKLPADRFAGAWDFAAALSDPSFRYGPESAEVGVSARWKRVAIGSAAVAALAMGFALSTIQPEGPPPPVIRYTTTLAQLSPTGSTGEFGISLALSPSGSSLVYVGDFEADHQLFMRARDELESTPISGTEGAYQPFFSPDGGQLGFLQQATRELKVMSLGGERPVTLLDSGVFRLGASWGADGYVYFSQMPHGGIGRVPETGGEIETISTPGDSEPDYVRHSWPDVLPSGRGVLITIQRAPNALGDEDDVAVVDVETGEVTVLFKGVLGRYSTSGHLLFVTHDGELAAAPFDQDRLEVTGSVVTLHSGVPVQRGPDVALSRSGRLVHATIQTSAVQELVWIDRTGAISQADPGSTFDPAEESGPALSPDGSSVALAVRTPQGHTEVWVKQLGGPLNRLLHGGMTSRPRWWLDDESILFVTNIGGAPDLYRQRADGSGDVALVLDLDVPLYDAVFSNREDWLVVRTGPAPESPTSDILAVPIGRDGEPVSLVARDDVQETSPALSADGRYLAYVSNELGYTQVYVRPFPNVDDARFPVGRGREPVWSPSGGELFYKNPSHELVAVSLGAGPDFEILEQTPLFELPPDALYYYGRATYDVDRAGQRFLMLRATGEAAEAQGHLVVENVHELLRSGDGG